MLTQQAEIPLEVVLGGFAVDSRRMMRLLSLYSPEPHSSPRDCRAGMNQGVHGPRLQASARVWWRRLRSSNHYGPRPVRSGRPAIVEQSSQILARNTLGIQVTGAYQFGQLVFSDFRSFVACCNMSGHICNSRLIATRQIVFVNCEPAPWSLLTLQGASL